MDITSPITLWKDYDVTALPFNASALSQKSENEITVKEYYFDGYTTVDGRVRAYIKISENPDHRGTVLYLCGSDGSVDDKIVKKIFDLGYTVAALDYLGFSQSAAHYTFYPQSLSYCNLRGETSFSIENNDKLSNWYIWTCISRRAVKFIETLYPNDKLFALGIGLGGSTVYKLSAFDDGLTACATLLNVIPNVSGEGNAIINYHASLDNSAYAPITQIPLFMAVASNDGDGSLDNMSELVANTESIRRFRIVERAFASGIFSVLSELDRFFSDCISSDLVMPWPEITASNSDGSLYFNIDIHRPENTADLEIDAQLKLFVSFCIEKAHYRNWMCLPTISLGKDKYIANINVCQGDKPIHAFANLVYSDGNVKSSTVLGIIPKNLGVKARVGVSHRKIYDSSMGVDGWTTRKGGSIKLVTGPYDIEGVTSDDNTIITFKPGDPLFKVSADTLLQLMLCGNPQQITISVNDGKNSYNCGLTLTNSDDWHKFSLSPINFKGTNGTLADWSEILLLEISSQEQLIVGSVLWV